MSKPKLLVIGDSPTCATGFGVVTNNVLANIGDKWDVHVLAVNYYGDPHSLQSRYKLYSPSLGGDVYGFNRLNDLLKGLQPDLIWIINDVWMCAEYIMRIRKQYNGPITVYTPVDSPGIKPQFVQPLNQATHVVTYTQWALDELRKSGLTTQASVIPHGVNFTHFAPMNKADARKELYGSLGDKVSVDDMFVVLYVARNQARKRVDLYPYIIGEWMKQYPHDNVYFHYHGAVNNDLGWDSDYLAWRYGVDKRFIVTSRQLTAQNGLPVEKLKYVYNAADVYLQICAVEGWSLPLHEAMACKIPAIVPDYSALSDWPRGAVYYTAVDPTPWHNPSNIDTEHRFINIQSAVDALEDMYSNPVLRETYAQKAYTHATQSKYMWRNIGASFKEVFNGATNQVLRGDPELWKKLQPKISLLRDN